MVIPGFDGSTRPHFKGLPPQAEEKASGEKLFKPHWKKTVASKKDALDIERQIIMPFPGLAAEYERNPREHGEKFTVRVPVKGPNGKTVDVLTAWIYDRLKEDKGGTAVQKGFKTLPRLTTIYVDPKSGARYEQASAPV